jgi:hypothetical protein
MRVKYKVHHKESPIAHPLPYIPMSLQNSESDYESYYGSEPYSNYETGISRASKRITKREREKKPISDTFTAYAYVVVVPYPGETCLGIKRKEGTEFDRVSILYLIR